MNRKVFAYDRCEHSVVGMNKFMYPVGSLTIWPKETLLKLYLVKDLYAYLWKMQIKLKYCKNMLGGPFRCSFIISLFICFRKYEKIR